MKKIFKPRDLNLKVYVEDTDFQGFVYHANYIKFFERARSEFLQDNKISQKELRINNCLLYTSPRPRDKRGSRMPSSA